MGFEMTQWDTDFFIAKKDKSAALKAVQALANKVTINQDTFDHFSFVGADFASKKTLEEISREWRWEMSSSKLDGNLDVIMFSGEKLGDDVIFLEAIAPFVRKGSFIIMRGEGGSTWKWTFDGTECAEIDGHATFNPEIPMEGIRVLRTILKEESTPGTLGLLLRGVLNRSDLDKAKEFIEAWGEDEQE